MSPLYSNWVSGTGPEDAQIWLVGEAPGFNEDRDLIPFVGKAGQRLDWGLREAGLIRSHMHLTNCFKQRPPENDISYFFFGSPKKGVLTPEGQKHIAVLRSDLERNRPSLILAVGDIPLSLLTGKSGITKWRGSLLPCTLVEGLRVFATYHPSYVMRLMQEEGKKQGKRGDNVWPIFIHDLRRAKEAAENPAIGPPSRQFILPKSASEVEAFLERLPSGYCILDIENLIEAPIITRVGIAPSRELGLSIPFILKGGAAWSGEDFKRILQCLSTALLRSDITWVAHNGMHDWTLLAFLWKLRPSSIEDTMVLAHATHSHLPKSLAFQTSAYTWEPYYKDDGKVHGIRAGDDALSIYNCKDVCVTAEILPHLKKEAEHYGTAKGYHRSLSYIPSLLAMGVRGVRVNQDLRNDLAKRFTERGDTCLGEIQDLMGKRYNISTAYTKDLSDLLYIDLTLPPQYKTSSEGGRRVTKLTTEDDALLKLLRLTAKEERSHRVLHLVRERKKLLKLISTYLTPPLGPDGRFHTTYDPTGTTTWRLSSYESPLGGGGNLQNIPSRPDVVGGFDYGREIRKCFIPDEGMEFLFSDLKQAEAMMVAWLAGEELEIRAFLEGADIHWINAQDIFDFREEKEKGNRDHALKRDVAKTVKHAGNYGMGPTKLQKILIKSGFYYEISECKEFLARVRRARPMIEFWKRRVEQQIDTDRTLVTPLQRKRIFYGRKGQELYRAAYAFIPQSTVGELMCMAIRDIFDFAEPLGGQIMMNVHDEVCMQVPCGSTEEWAHRIRPLIEREIIVGARPLTIPCDFKRGPSWGEKEEFFI